MRILWGNAGLVLIAGCGGSSSGGDAPGPIGPVNSFGPIETRGQVKGTPIVRDLRTISTVALAGVLTDATYRPQGIPDNETAITVATSNFIDLIEEDGDPIATWEPKYNGASLNPSFPRWTPDGQRLYFRSENAAYYVTPTDPSTAVRVLTGIGGRIGISPDGTKLGFSKIPTGEGDYEVFTSTLSGTSQTRVTTNTDNDFFYIWADNARIIASAFGTDETRVYNLNGTVSAVYGSDYNAPLAKTADGRYFFNGYSDTPGYYFDITERQGTGFNSQAFLEATTGLDVYTAGSSPNGQRWVYFEEYGVTTTELFPVYRTQVKGITSSSLLGGDWQPALGVTRFVGASGKLGTTSAGIVATFRTDTGRNGLSSFVNWDCQTRSTSTVSDDATPSDAGTKTYTIEADRLTALRYGNYPLFQNVSTVSSTGTANGAIVTVESQNGKVANIIVFQETRGAKPTVRIEGKQKVVEGSILSVWDGAGRNLAPAGASRVLIDELGKATLG
ncbi:hypothetical protein EON81_22765 [bacterium]|nr:MAG: hypothetical protein EON81_22765 [bacterium]